MTAQEIVDHAKETGTVWLGGEVRYRPVNEAACP